MTSERLKQRKRDRRAAGLCPDCGRGTNGKFYCTKCSSRRNKKYPILYLRKANMIDRLKLNSGCADCGYRLHPAALEFDHLPGCIKVATIATLRRTGGGIKKLLAEIEKCEIVCANCHAIRTYERKYGRHRLLSAAE